MDIALLNETFLDKGAALKIAPPRGGGTIFIPWWWLQDHDHFRELGKQKQSPLGWRQEVWGDPRIEQHFARILQRDALDDHPATRPYPSRLAERIAAEASRPSPFKRGK